MSKETLVKRNYGSETEYGYSVSQGGFLERKNDWVLPPGVKNSGDYLQNGSRLYLDIQLVEYATPECPTLDDIVTHELVGEQLIWDAFGNGRSRITTFHKRARNPLGKTMGSHENYTTTVDITDRPDSEAKKTKRAILAAHFITRNVFLGAGQPTEEGGYNIGQKMHDIDYASGAGTTSAKALVNTRDEPLSGANNSPLKRLHVICGDANMSPWAIRMKYGTTSLVLRLLEHGVPMGDLAISNGAVQEAKRVAGNIAEMDKLITLGSGDSRRRMTALDIQEQFALRAKKLSERVELPQDELEVLNDWIAIIDALKRYRKTGGHQKELTQIDWYTKKTLINQKKEQGDYANLTVEDKYKKQTEWDVLYHMVPAGWGVNLRNRRFAPSMPSQEKLIEGKSVPPEGRAKLRGEIIEESYKYIIKDRYIDWERATINGRAIRMPIDASYGQEERMAHMQTLFASTTPLDRGQ